MTINSLGALGSSLRFSELPLSPENWVGASPLPGWRWTLIANRQSPTAQCLAPRLCSLGQPAVKSSGYSGTLDSCRVGVQADTPPSGGLLQWCCPRPMGPLILTPQPRFQPGSGLGVWCEERGWGRGWGNADPPSRHPLSLNWFPHSLDSRYWKDELTQMLRLAHSRCSVNRPPSPLQPTLRRQVLAGPGEMARAPWWRRPAMAGASQLSGFISRRNLGWGGCSARGWRACQGSFPAWGRGVGGVKALCPSSLPPPEPRAAGKAGYPARGPPPVGCGDARFTPVCWVAPERGRCVFPELPSVAGTAHCGG